MTASDIGVAARRASRFGADPFSELDRLRDTGTRIATADWLDLVAAAHDVSRAETSFQATIARVTHRA